MDPFRIDADAIITRARKKSGFSGSIPKAEEGLRRLTESIQRDGKPNPFGALAVKGLLERLLYGRYKVEQELARNPWIEEQEIREPIFIIGMPRTGTTILHAILPYKYVDHTHADAVVTITNTPNGEQRIRELYGDRVLVIPYVMPGFDLARICAEVLEKERGEQTIGMVLMNHGIFSFAQTAKESYERMIELVGMAENYLQQHQAWLGFSGSLL